MVDNRSELLHNIDMQSKPPKRQCMGVKPEELGQMRCAMNVQINIVSTPIVESHSHKLTS